MRSFTAIRFELPTERGLTRPFLVTGIDEEENEVIIVVKPNEGYEQHGGLEYRNLEAFSLLLANALKLPAVEPVFVEIPEGLEFGALDFRAHTNNQGAVTNFVDLIEKSVGSNLGTVHLGTDWKQWNQATRPHKILKNRINDAFCFDALVQNDDRKGDNPNLLWKGDQLALLDFDRAWGLISDSDDPYPWRNALSLLTLSQHVLRPHLRLPRSHSHPIQAPFQENLSEIDLPNLAASLFAEVEAGLPGSNLDFSCHLDYLTKLARIPDDLFAYLTQLLRR